MPFLETCSVCGRKQPEVPALNGQVPQGWMRSPRSNRLFCPTCKPAKGER